MKMSTFGTLMEASLLCTHLRNIEFTSLYQVKLNQSILFFYMLLQILLYTSNNKRTKYYNRKSCAGFKIRVFV